MVSSSEVRVVCPSVSFLFARLGASLGISRAFFLLVGNVVFEGSGLGVALGELYSLLSQRSIGLKVWWVREKECLRLDLVNSRLGCLLTTIWWKGIPPSLPSERLGLFMPWKRCVVWTMTHFVDLGVDFSSQIGLRFVYPTKRSGLAISSLGGMLLRSYLPVWTQVPCSLIYYGALGSFWNCSWATYAQFVEDSGQLYGDMAGCYRRRYD